MAYSKGVDRGNIQEMEKHFESSNRRQPLQPLRQKVEWVKEVVRQNAGKLVASERTAG